MRSERDDLAEGLDQFDAFIDAWGPAFASAAFGADDLHSLANIKTAANAYLSGFNAAIKEIERKNQ